MAKVEARDSALAALYASDIRGLGEPCADELSSRALRLVTAVWAERSDLDAMIESASSGWRVSRMPAVDRNILRLALCELRATDTPVGVIISEAVRLAKSYSTERSGAFVNGVLGTLAERIERPKPAS